MKREEKFERLERIYNRWNRAEYIDPDPLQWLRKWGDMRDREVVGLVAAGLAYGRVASINASIAQVVPLLGGHPARRVREAEPGEWARPLAGFKHRWTTGEEVARLLDGLGAVLRTHGSVEAVVGSAGDPERLESGLGVLVDALSDAGAGRKNSMLSDPRGTSASKRVWMYARWMVRNDDVDPGGWSLPAAGLRVPMDTHMFQLCRGLRWVRSRQPGRLASEQATRAFARGVPEDPVRYDFCLTRLGIRADADYSELFA